MADEQENIKIQFDTNAREAAQDTNQLANSLDSVTESSDGSSGSAKKLAGSLRDLDSPINSTISSMKLMLKQMWAIVANPLGAILAAIALVLVGLVAVFRTFTPLVDKLEQSMAALGAVFNLIKNTFFDVLTGTKSLGEAFGGLSGDMSEATRRTMALVAAQQDLEDAMARQEIQTARNRAEINKLEVQAKNRQLSEEERIKFLDRASAIRKEDFKQRVSEADEEVRIAREAIAIKARFSKDEIKFLKEQGLAAKDLAESKNGNFDDEFKALGEAQKKRIGLEDENTANLERNLNKRDKLEDDQKAKLDRIAEINKARAEKAKAAREKEIEEQKVLNQKKLDEEKRVQDELTAYKLQGIKRERDLFEEEFQKDKEQKQKQRDELNQAIADQDAKELESQRVTNEAKIALAENLEASKVSITDKFLNLFSLLAGKNKKLQKAAIIAEGAVGIARTVRSTAEGNTAALSLGILQAGPVAGPAIAAPAITANTINGAISGATIVASTAKALSALGGGSAPSASSIPSGGGSGARGSATPSIDFNNSQQNQIGQSIAKNEANKDPIIVQLKESDVTKAQKNVAVLVTKNTF